MINNFIVNSELYTLAFTTSDNMHFDLIRNCIKGIIPSSKQRFTYSDRQDTLLVFDKYYEQTIDTVTSFMKGINKEQDVYWVSKKGIKIPCGYYQVALANINPEKTNLDEEVEQYAKTINDSLLTNSSISFDSFTRTYSISLYKDSYNAALQDFSNFVLEKGIGPFKNLQVTSRYGELTKRYIIQ